MTDNVFPVCLPDVELDSGAQTLSGYGYDPKECVATGWGKDAWGAEGQYQVVMKQVQMDLVESNQCQDRLRDTKLGRFFRLHSSFVCAGGAEGVDTCKGDGGGPLVCPVRDDDGNVSNYVQVGIVAWGIECGGGGVPGVYANINEGRCFLEMAAECSAATDSTDTWNGLSGDGVPTQCKGWLKKQLRDLRKKRNDLR